MGEAGRNDMEKALRAVASMIERSAKAQQKFVPGTAQHTLQQNRISALRIAAALLGPQPPGKPAAAAFTKEALEKARAPIASLISKSEKAQKKLPPEGWQYAMLEDNLCALRLAAPLLEAALAEKKAEG